MIRARSLLRFARETETFIEAIERAEREGNELLLGGHVYPAHIIINAIARGVHFGVSDVLVRPRVTQ